MRVGIEPELEALRASVDAQARKLVAPHAAHVDRDQTFSPELWEGVRSLGLTRLPFAPEHGGEGGNARAYAVASMEVARHCAVAALYPGVTIQVAMQLLAHGTTEQITRFVPMLVSGEAIAAWAFTEPGTGSDPKQIATRAARVAGGWVLNGSKQFISFSGQARLAMVFARTSPDALGAFVVDTSGPGWQVGSHSELLSLGGTEARPVTLTDLFVPDDGLVGAEGAGFDVMLAGETFGKVRASAICVGIALRALEVASDYAQGREWRSIPIGQRFPTLQALLGSAAAEVLAAEALVLATAAQLDRGDRVAGQAASCRLVAGQAARRATLAALHACGAYGLTKDMIVERLYREAVFFDVAQGVSEIQQIIAARELLGEAARREEQ